MPPRGHFFLGAGGYRPDKAGQIGPDRKTTTRQYRINDVATMGEKMKEVRTLGLLGSIVALLLGDDHCARAQSNYPNHPIHVVVPYPAGGIVDIVARTVTEQVGRDLKQ